MIEYISGNIAIFINQTASSFVRFLDHEELKSIFIPKDLVLKPYWFRDLLYVAICEVRILPEVLASLWRESINISSVFTIFRLSFFAIHKGQLLVIVHSL